MKRDALPALDAADRGVLRFLTCGSVDDGKSTLIGRLLYDSRALLADTLDTLHRHAERRGLAAPDLSLLTDGLTAEREQGITIDVAYRYFATARRKFIIADAPGHEQYTRNMVTAASTAEVAVLLVDARHGVLPQTRRHAALAALLGVRQMILAVNKMDLADWSQPRFETLVAEFRGWLAQHPELAVDLRAIPLSALQGAMVAERGSQLPWYTGPTLLTALEEAPAMQRDPQAPLRLPVQWVCRPGGQAPRSYAGRIEAGSLAVGDEIVVQPSGARSRVTALALGEAPLARAVAGQSIRVTLADERDVSRGDLLTRASEPALPLRRDFGATVCWLHAQPLTTARSYLLQHTTRSTRAKIAAVDGRLDLHSLAWQVDDGASPVGLNDIVRLRLRTQQPLAADAYRSQRDTGSFILIDEVTHETVAAGTIDG
jgi:sulfate adenylyltransferase subunit 1